MAWQDRLKEAAYTSPSGTRQRFDYEDVRKTVEKKTTAFDFPDANGSYIQDLGHSGRQYPLQVFFWGADCDTQADAFEELLLEIGVGKLEHPIYGTVDVVPFGAITRRDDLKSAANQTIIEVTFWETIGVIYPTAQSDPASQVLSAVSDFNEAAATQLNDSLTLESIAERLNFKNTYKTLLDSAKSGLQAVADTQDDVRSAFNAVYDSITAGIDVLIATPLDLAFQTAVLLQSPARAVASISDRLNAYADLATAILTDGGAQVGSNSRNEFHTEDLYATTYVVGSVLSAVNTKFDTKTEALRVAAALLSQFESVTAWRDDRYGALSLIDTGAAYQKLHEAVSLAAGFLVYISFSLKQEKRIFLDRSRTIIDLVAELYGSIDDIIDFFILSNGLTGSEILELPAGREIVYYV